jgi:hypothetical protein
MRFFLSVFVVLSCCGPLFSQRPRLFTEKLGNHPQFPFLQYEKGISTRALFLKAVKDPASRRRYKTEFTVFNRLLQDIGFTKGYKDLGVDDIEDVFIHPGTIGRLGFFNKESNYIYVKLSPAGEGDAGIAAWKITGPSGRYIHILHTCGNAFFIDGAAPGRRDCPCDTSAKANSDTVYKTDTVVKKDIVYIRIADSGKTICHKKWEITLDGGASVNSIPRFAGPIQHSRSNSASPAAELTVSRIFNHWFQAGISAGYLTLSYQDDVVYPGGAPNTWNTVYPAKPVIPLQLFAKATIGGALRWQANISVSAGYSLVSGDKIVSNGATLGAKPGTKGGPTAGLKLGIAYFFNCRWGLGISFAGQYFDNKATAISYHLMALPVTAGIRYRF